MNWLNNLAMRNKLLILIVPPMLALVFLFAERIWLATEHRDDMHALLQETQLLAVLNPIVTQLQRERARVAIFLGNVNEGNTAQALKQQQQLSDEAIQAFARAPSRQQAKDLDSSLQDLTQLRQQVAARSVASAEAIAGYTRIIASFMLKTDAVLSQAASSDILRSVAVYSAMTNMAELTGQERAVGLAYIRAGQFNTDRLLPVVNLQGQQDSWSAMVNMFSDEQGKTAWRQVLASNENQRLLSLRAVLITPDFTNRLTPDDWYSVTTARIDKLNSVKEAVLQQVVLRAEQDEQQARQRLWGSLVGVFIIVGLGCVVALAMVRQLSSQVGRMTQAITVAMRTKDLTVPVKTNSTDEIGQISNLIDGLYSEFSSSLQQLDSASGQLAQAMQRSADITSQNTMHIDEQQQQVVQVATASEEMSATSAQISQSVAQVADAAHSVREKSENGENHVKDSVSQVRELTRSVGAVDGLMQDLQQRSSSMLQVIDVIRNLADQTNLLALNAAIEAARAGEHGRGFAVVADEVRKLASQTHSSTQQIQDIIGSFTELAGSAASSIQESHKVSEQTLQLSNDLEQIFDEILEDVKRISDMSAEIATASEEQVAVSKEVAQSMDIISTGANQTYRGAVEIHEVTEQQLRLAEQLKSLAHEFKTR